MDLSHRMSWLPLCSFLLACTSAPSKGLSSNQESRHRLLCGTRELEGMISCVLGQIKRSISDHRLLTEHEMLSCLLGETWMVASQATDDLGCLC